MFPNIQLLVGLSKLLTHVWLAGITVPGWFGIVGDVGVVGGTVGWRGWGGTVVGAIGFPLLSTELTGHRYLN
jgi:hypothetical protein